MVAWAVAAMRYPAAIAAGAVPFRPAAVHAPRIRETPAGAAHQRVHDVLVLEARVAVGERRRAAREGAADAFVVLQLREAGAEGVAAVLVRARVRGGDLVLLRHKRLGLLRVGVLQVAVGVGDLSPVQDVLDVVLPEDGVLGCRHRGCESRNRGPARRRSSRQQARPHACNNEYRRHRTCVDRESGARCATGNAARQPRNSIAAASLACTHVAAHETTSRRANCRPRGYRQSMTAEADDDSRARAPQHSSRARRHWRRAAATHHRTGRTTQPAS